MLSFSVCRNLLERVTFSPIQSCIQISRHTPPGTCKPRYLVSWFSSLVLGLGLRTAFPSSLKELILCATCVSASIHDYNIFLISPAQNTFYFKLLECYFYPKNVQINITCLCSEYFKCRINRFSLYN